MVVLSKGYTDVQELGVGETVYPKGSYNRNLTFTCVCGCYLGPEGLVGQTKWMLRQQYQGID